MVEVKLSNWLSKDDFDEKGELVVSFVDSGAYRMQPSFDGQSEVETFVVTVEFSAGQATVQKEWSPNKTSLGRLVKKFGSESEKWVGQVAPLKLFDQVVQGKDRKVIFVQERP